MCPELRHVCVIEASVAPVRDLGPTPHGRRRIVPILGGTVQGPRLQAEVLPGGADWQYVRGDGVVELVARYSIRTADGVEIAVTNSGLRRAAPEVMARMAAGEPVDPALVYCRTAPQFEAPEGPYEWLNRSVFLGSATRLPDRVRIEVFEVL
ncbi:MAG TPA: DUF3237 domain-containing protein [Hyphomicrobiaceae bacterium]|nr:DUF3237 domain-containing protein [Hyphomicrobiaceae bacterium]